MDKNNIKELDIKGIYFTHLVKELINVFLSAKKPLLINEIIGIFNKQNFYPYQSSLYRQLHRLTSLKVIEKIFFSDGMPRYFFIYKNKHFCHFRCCKCGYIESVPITKRLFANHYFEKNSYDIINNSIVLEGFCSKCKK